MILSLRIVHNKRLSKFEEIYLKFKDVTLESMSLFLLDRPIFQAQSIQNVTIQNELTDSLTHLKWISVLKEEEVFLPRAWDMPEVFRKKLIAQSGFQLNETRLIQNLTEAIRYNFSNGMQLSAQEVLRHPIAKVVPLYLLPQVYTKIQQTPIQYLPFVPHQGPSFKTQSFTEVEVIMDDLFKRILSFFHKGELTLYLQSDSITGKGLRLQHIHHAPFDHIDWRVQIEQRAKFEAEFKLMIEGSDHVRFFESFLLDSKNRSLYIYSWKNEAELIQDQYLMADKSETPTWTANPFHFQVYNEIQFKKLLKYLKGRSIPVQHGGRQVQVPENQTRFTFHLLDDKSFQIEFEGKASDEEVIFRKEPSEFSEQLVRTMSLGLCEYLGAEAKDLASPQASRREWDLKLLKHTGIIQYVTFECLNLVYKEELSDGRRILESETLEMISENIKNLLLLGPGTTFLKDRPLQDICSKSVLIYLQKWIDYVFVEIRKSETIFTNEAEYHIEGFFHSEARWIHQVIEKMIFDSRGEIFKRARSTFYQSVTQFSGSILDLLASLQELTQYNYQLKYKGFALQELDENQIKVDFVLESIFDENKNFNWFELNPKVFLNGEAVESDQFIAGAQGRLIEFQGQIYILKNQAIPSIRRLQHFWTRLQKGQDKTKSKKFSDKIYQIPKSQTLELLALRASGVQIRGDFEWQRICQFYDELGQEKKYLNLPPTIKAELKSYQEVGVQWLYDLYQLRLGALLADDMGLGKTLQALSFLEILRTKQQLGRVLIVVPSSLVFNWQFEIQKFTPDIPFTIFSAKMQDEIGKLFVHQQDGLVITTYGLLMEHHQFFDQYPWSIVLFDEAQNLKNMTTKRTSAARSLQAQFKICLTGTPMENHYGEFYSLMDILVPGSLGPVDQFRRQFVNTQVITLDQMADLKLKMKPLILRRTKKEILDQLPEKQESKISIAFEERQREIYRDVALSYNHQIQDALATDPKSDPTGDEEMLSSDSTGSVQLQMLTALLRLRQVCSDPSALPNVVYDRIPPKIETLVESLEEIISSGESALVFTQFLQTLNRTAKVLQDNGIPYFVLHGGLNSKQRQQILSDFQNKEGGAVLVMTLKTGGVGLNLTKASYVFHLEPWWNPSVENQATDRVHRLGQKKSVQVFKYIMHESLEEKIEQLKLRKDIKFQALFSEDSEKTSFDKGSQALSKEDFDYLIKI